MKKSTFPGTQLLFEKTGQEHFNLQENPFPIVYFDVWPYCDMDCNICYNAEAMANSVKKNAKVTDSKAGYIPKVTVEFFEDVVSKLGQNYQLDIADHVPASKIKQGRPVHARNTNPQEIILLGGEPTTHPDFFEFLEIIHKYGHNAYVSTNGKRLSKNMDFCHRIKETVAGRKLRFHMDISGGLDRDLNKAVHNEDSLDFKLQALENLQEAGLGKMTISCILVRDFNEHIIGDMFEIAARYPKVIREIDFRSQGLIGNYIGNGRPYLTNEWLRLMREQNVVTSEEIGTAYMGGQFHEECAGKNCCFKFKVKRGGNVHIVSWIDFLCDHCWLRGQIVADQAEPKVEYMFEHIEDNNTYGKRDTSAGAKPYGQNDFRHSEIESQIKRGIAKIDMAGIEAHMQKTHNRARGEKVTV